MVPRVGVEPTNNGFSVHGVHRFTIWAYRGFFIDLVRGFHYPHWSRALTAGMGDMTGLEPAKSGATIPRVYHSTTYHMVPRIGF